MDNIYEALRESHETQRTLCRRLLRTKPDDPKAQEIFDTLRIELAAHAAAEERYLYAQILFDDMGLSSSRHALAEHHEIDECVEAMEEARGKPEAWMALARKLSHRRSASPHGTAAIWTACDRSLRDHRKPWVMRRMLRRSKMEGCLPP